MKFKKYNRGHITRTEAGTYLAIVNHAYQTLRKTLPTEAAARTWIDSKIIEIDNQEPPLTVWQLREAQKAFSLLPPGESLLEIIKARQRQINASQTPLGEIIEQFLEDKSSSGLRKNSMDTLKYQVAKLSQIWGDLNILEITAPMLSEWINTNGGTGWKRDGFRRAFKNLFSWAIKQGFIDFNPARGISPSLQTESIPEIFLVEIVKKILYGSQEHTPGMTLYYALGFFAGIRPRELQLLEYKSINDYIHIPPEISKIRYQRFITISENLKKWIDAYPGSGLICPASHRKQRKKLMQIISLEKWTQDIMRHCYGSYHLALYQDAPRTAHEMGHSSPDTLYRYYRNLVSQGEAKQYFNIVPDTKFIQ